MGWPDAFYEVEIADKAGAEDLGAEGGGRNFERTCMCQIPEGEWWAEIWGGGSEMWGRKGYMTFRTRSL